MCTMRFNIKAHNLVPLPASISAALRLAGVTGFELVTDCSSTFAITGAASAGFLPFLGLLVLSGVLSDAETAMSRGGKRQLDDFAGSFIPATTWTYPWAWRFLTSPSHT